LLSDRDAGDLLDRIVGLGCRGLLQTKCPPAMIVKAIRAISCGELWLPRAWLARSAAGHARTLGPIQGGAPRSEPGSHTEDMLTEREAQIVAQLRQGFTNKEIARRLGIQEDTVKKHLQSVFGKLGVRRRALVVLGRMPPGRLSA
jgi:DNA-binding NarL/FixJ family response regulator